MARIRLSTLKKREEEKKIVRLRCVRESTVLKRKKGKGKRRGKKKKIIFPLALHIVAKFPLLFLEFNRKREGERNKETKRKRVREKE